MHELLPTIRLDEAELPRWLQEAGMVHMMWACSCGEVWSIAVFATTEDERVQRIMRFAMEIQDHPYR